MSNGPWIITYTGRQAFLADPQPEVVCIEDIAHALARLCRYTGHVSSFYSVAQHSTLVSDVCAPKDALVGLLHDAAEAYLGDLSGPLKTLLPAFCDLEQRWLKAIGERFEVDLIELPEEVKDFDISVRAAERRDLFPPSPARDAWHVPLEPYFEQIIVPQSPDAAELSFLSCWRRFMRR